MNDGLIPRRYAKALFKVAQEKQQTEPLYLLMGKLADSFKANAQLQKTIANPYVDPSRKVELLKTAAGCGDEGNPLFSDFLSLLIKNKRISSAWQIALAYLELYRKANRIYVVDVTSAAPLSSSEMERLKNLVLSHLPEGASIELSSAVDPSLIGGFTVTIDNELLDASIKNELKQLRLNLLRN